MLGAEQVQQCQLVLCWVAAIGVAVGIVSAFLFSVVTDPEDIAQSGEISPLVSATRWVSNMSLVVSLVGVAGIGVLTVLPSSPPAGPRPPVVDVIELRTEAGAGGSRFLATSGLPRVQPVGGALPVSRPSLGNAPTVNHLVLEVVGLDTVPQPPSRSPVCVGLLDNGLAAHGPISPWREITPGRSHDRPAGAGAGTGFGIASRAYGYELRLDGWTRVGLIALPPLHLAVTARGEHHVCLAIGGEYTGRIILQ